MSILSTLNKLTGKKDKTILAALNSLTGKTADDIEEAVGNLSAGGGSDSKVNVHIFTGDPQDAISYEEISEIKALYTVDDQSTFGEIVPVVDVENEDIVAQMPGGAYFQNISIKYTTTGETWITYDVDGIYRAVGDEYPIDCSFYIPLIGSDVYAIVGRVE